MLEMDTQGLPPEVAAQAEQVKRFMAEAAGTGATGEQQVDAGTTANADQAQPASHAQGQTTEHAATPATPADAGFGDGQGTATVTPAQEGQQPQQSQQSDDTAEHRYRVLQGIHRADVNRLTQQVGDLKTENDRLQAELEALRSQSGTGAAATTAAKSPADSLDEQLEAAEIESDFNRVRELRAKIRERDRDEAIKAVRQEFEPIRQQVATNATERYVSDLNALAPGWDKAKSNPAFAEFLQQPAPYTGVPLIQILNQADFVRDAVRVSEIYNAFLQQQNRQAAPDQKSGQQRGLPQTMVAPARSTGGSATTPQPKSVTREQLEAAAADVGKGLLTAEAYVTLQQQYLQQSVFKE